MRNQRFENGTLVELKSGGPTMTVGGLRSGEIICYWFDNNEQKIGTFPKECLKEDKPIEIDDLDL